MRVEINSLLSSILAFKKNSNSTQFIGLCFGVSEQIIPLQTIGVQFLAPATSACHPMIWQSFLKASPEDNWRIRLQNQWPSSWGSAPAQLQVGPVWLSSTNTGCFLVSCRRCGPQQACLRKTCYHSCFTDSVRQSKRFYCIVDIGQQLITFFSMWNESFDGIGEKLLQIKAVPIS